MVGRGNGGILEMDIHAVVFEWVDTHCFDLHFGLYRIYVTITTRLGMLPLANLTVFKPKGTRPPFTGITLFHCAAQTITQKAKEGALQCVIKFNPRKGRVSCMLMALARFGTIDWKDLICRADVGHS